MRNETKILRDVIIQNETFALFVETLHKQGSVKAMTAVHRQEYGERQGGVRLVDSGGTIEELANLTKAMSDKCAASRLPVDALRSLVVTSPGRFTGAKEKAKILAEHFRAVLNEDPGAVFGPDMRCGEDVLSRVAGEPDLLKHVTGLSEEMGGLEINKRGYTAFGLACGLNLALKGKIRSRSFSIQGFGSVGARAAQLISEMGGIIKAVSNSRYLLTAPNGLDIEYLFNLWRKSGNESLLIYSREKQTGNARLSSKPEEIFEIPVDGFIPAARTSVLALPEELSFVRRENPASFDAARFLQKTGVKIIVEGANYPLTENAESYLEDHGVIILPDVLVNSGGLIGTRLEWENRNQASVPETLSHLDGICRRRIRETIEFNTERLLFSKKYARQTVQEIIEDFK